MELPFRLLMNLTPMKIPAYKAVHWHLQHFAYGKGYKQRILDW
jgi:hypothetical protein